MKTTGRSCVPSIREEIRASPVCSRRWSSAFAGWSHTIALARVAARRFRLLGRVRFLIGTERIRRLARQTPNPAMFRALLLSAIDLLRETFLALTTNSNPHRQRLTAEGYRNPPAFGGAQTVAGFVAKPRFDIDKASQTVNISETQPQVRYNAAQPVAQIASEGEPQVQFNQSGEARVQIRQLSVDETREMAKQQMQGQTAEQR
ncbi:hypothetical protein [Thiocapsa sp.]|uniref:hypothetical protein n=1 Tax=Thiocapsa sp. TaxID=2024551 RepID=UPI0025DC12B5|nr:hypothetical protein [Thiocapsa sp.]